MIDTNLLLLYLAYYNTGMVITFLYLYYNDNFSFINIKISFIFLILIVLAYPIFIIFYLCYYLFKQFLYK